MKDEIKDSLSRSERRAAKQVREDEMRRISQIRSAAKVHNFVELGEQGISEGWTYDAFNEACMEKIGERNDNARVETNDIGSYSGRASISSRSTSREFDNRRMESLHGFMASAAGLTNDDLGPFKERSQEISRITGRKPFRGQVDGSLLPDKTWSPMPGYQGRSLGCDRAAS